MLDLEELFNKRPFIYLVNDVYYAFGVGVCARCDNNFITLPLRYQRYVESFEMDDISQKEAWEIYRKLVSVADAVKSNEEHMHLIEQFSSFQFVRASNSNIFNS